MLRFHVQRPGLRRMPLVAAGAVAIAASPSLAGAAPRASTHYLYYLHGKIVEDKGPRGVDPRFGAYDYLGIVAALSRPGITLVSEVRPSGTDPAAYADKVASRIRGQIRSGVPASHITVAGASKGSVIAALVSSKLQVRGVRYVLMANCNDWLIRTYNPRLSGDVLSIYEASDDIGGTCAPLVKRSPAVGRFNEIRLATGLGHGVLYQPNPGWVRPTIAWAAR